MRSDLPILVDRLDTWKPSMPVAYHLAYQGEDEMDIHDLQTIDFERKQGKVESVERSLLRTAVAACSQEIGVSREIRIKSE